MMDLVKELKALNHLPHEVQEQKMNELLERFFSDEENVDQIFGVLAGVCIKVDK
jgi:hypothetical protein